MHDESASHNFHLTGPGVDRSTEVSWSGTVTWSVDLGTGSYRFQCDPHNDFMNGSFTVGSSPPPAPPPPPPPSGESVLTGFVGPGYDIGLRDANGWRPLVLGRMESGAYVLASESCALDLLGATMLREVAPGELVRLDARGLESRPFLAPGPLKQCIFEHIYFSRPDSVVYGETVDRVREAIGIA